MDCHDARLLLTLQRREPEQLDRIELEAIERHVELCPGCQTWNRSEARFESALSSAVKNVLLPAGLKDKIVAGLAKSPRPRRKAWAALAAAALLAAVATGSYFWLQPATIDLEQLVIFDDDQSSRPEAVQSYFADLGYPMTPPPQFQYDYLLAYKLARFQGKIVPRLTFQCRQDKGGVVTAHVYCLSSRDFRQGDDQLTPVTTSPQRQIQVLHDERELYVVDCTGGGLWMLQRGTF